MKFQTHVDIAAPASTVWSIVGEQFGEIAAWAPGLDSSSLEGNLGVGAVRTCRGAGIGIFKTSGVVVRERLLDFDASNMTFRYAAIEGLPKFIRRAENRWTVTALGPNRCRVTMQARIELRGLFVLLAPLFPLLTRSMVRQVFTALARRTAAVQSANVDAPNLRSSTGG